MVIEHRIGNVVPGMVWMERAGPPCAEEDPHDVEGLANLVDRAHCPGVGWVLKK